MELHLGMDSVKIRVEFKPDIDQDLEYKQMHQFKQSVKDKEFLPKGKAWSLSKSALTKVSQPLNATSTFVVTYGYSHGRHRAWFQFNPGKCDEDASVKLGAYLSMQLHRGFRSLVERGKFVYCELAVDVDGAAFGDYLFIDTRLRAASNAHEAVGSSYLGSALGARSFICYDKRKQMLANGQDLAHDRLRIEARLRGAAGFEFRDTFEVPNPFSSLMVIDRKRLASSTDPDLASFRQHLDAGSDSAQTCYSGQPKLVRAKLRVALATVAADWWLPEVIWLEQYPDCLDWAAPLLAEPGWLQPIADQAGAIA